MASNTGTTNEIAEFMRSQLDTDEFANFKSLVARMLTMWGLSYDMDTVRITDINRVNANKCAFVFSGIDVMNTDAMHGLIKLDGFTEYCAEVSTSVTGGVVHTEFVMLRASRGCTYSDVDPMPSFLVQQAHPSSEQMHSVVHTTAPIGDCCKRVVDRVVMLCEHIYPGTPHLGVQYVHTAGEPQYALEVTGLPGCCYTLLVSLNTDSLIAARTVEYTRDSCDSDPHTLRVFVALEPVQPETGNWLSRGFNALTGRNKRRRVE